MDTSLPFPRGTTLDSGSYGSVPNNLIGQTHRLADGTVLRVCKNVDAAALSGGRIIRLNSSQGSALVNEASGAGDARQYGITDYRYQSGGVTIPANALFYAQQAGVGRVLFGNSVAAGQPVTSHATDGTVASVARSLAVQTTDNLAVLGVTIAAVNSGSYGYVSIRPII